MDDRQDLAAAHLHDDFVAVAAAEKGIERAASHDAVAARREGEQDVDASEDGELRRQT